MMDQETLKTSNPDAKVSHIELVEAIAMEQHHLHLPRNVSQTEIERKEQWFVGSIDQGTTSSRFLIFDGEGTPVANHQIEFENIYPESG